MCYVYWQTLPRARGGVLSCPKCRKKTTCTVGQVEKLATNAYAIHMITAAANNNNPAAPQIGYDNLLKNCSIFLLMGCIFYNIGWKIIIKAFGAQTARKRRYLPV